MKIDVKFWFSISMSVLIGILGVASQIYPLPVWVILSLAILGGVVIWRILSFTEWLIKENHRRKEQRQKEERRKNNTQRRRKPYKRPEGGERTIYDTDDNSFWQPQW